MALQATITLASGATTTYHRILRATADYTAQAAELTVGLYVDGAARNAGLVPVERRVYRVQASATPMITMPGSIDIVTGPWATEPGRQEAYGWLKGHADFTGASDV